VKGKQRFQTIEDDSAHHPPKTPVQMSGLRRWSPVLLFTGFILSLEVVFASLEPLLDHAALQQNLMIFVNIVMVAVLVFFLAYILWVGQKQSRVRTFVLLLIAGLSLASFNICPHVLEKVHVLLYFPLGVLIYRAKQQRLGPLRYCLDVLFIFLIIAFVDQIVQGLHPNRSYSFVMRDYASFTFMGIAGMLFGRIRDPEAPETFFKKQRREKVYEGKKPLIDIHIYQYDFLYPVLIVLFVLFSNNITERYQGNVLEGRYRVEEGRGATATLEDGTLYCEKRERKEVVGWYEVSGNLLDGFYLYLIRSEEWEEEGCSALKSFLGKHARFRKRGGSILFEDTIEDWKWAIWSIFEMKGNRDKQEMWEKLK